MKRMARVLALTGSMTLGVGLLAATPAEAGPPQVVHTKVNVSFTNIDQCGFTVNSIVQGTDTFKVTVDKSGTASYQDESHFVSTLTNVANGKVVHIDSAGRDNFSDGGVVNSDGTTTFTDTSHREWTCGSTPAQQRPAAGRRFPGNRGHGRLRGELPQRAANRSTGPTSSRATSPLCVTRSAPRSGSCRKPNDPARELTGESAAARCARGRVGLRRTATIRSWQHHES